MVVLPATDGTEAYAKACEIYNAECDALGCRTPERERVTKCHYPPMQHADTRAIAAVVTDTRRLTPADSARAVTVASRDEEKWQPKWDAGSISPKP